MGIAKRETHNVNGRTKNLIINNDTRRRYIQNNLNGSVLCSGRSRSHLRRAASGLSDKVRVAPT